MTDRAGHLEQEAPRPNSQTYKGWKRVQLPSIADQLDAVLRPPADVARPETRTDRTDREREQRREQMRRRRDRIKADLTRIRAEGRSMPDSADYVTQAEFERVQAEVETSIPKTWRNGEPMHELDQIEPVVNDSRFMERFADLDVPEADRKAAVRTIYVEVARELGYGR